MNSRHELTSTITCMLSALVLLTFATAPVSRAQSCSDIPQGGGESISASITIRNSGQPVSANGVVPSSTWIDINALATAFGQCIGMAIKCQPSPCVCQETGSVYERTVNHIGVYVDISTSGSLNGTYFVSNVYGKNPQGTLAFFHVLDTGAPRIPLVH
jgi:hypothetical protein